MHSSPKTAPQVKRHEPCSSLFLRDKIIPSVLLPAMFSTFRADRLFLAEADKRNPLPRNAEVGQIFLCAGGAPLAEGLVVLLGPPFIAIAFDPDLHLRVSIEPLGICLHHGLCIVSYKKTVK